MAHGDVEPAAGSPRVALCLDTDRNDAAGAGVAQTTRPRDRTHKGGSMQQIVTAPPSDSDETALLVERLLDAATGGRTPLSGATGEARRWLAAR